MTTNMIGVRKRIIVYNNEGTYVTMFNLEIIKKTGPYDTEEDCLSLHGGLGKCKRYKLSKYNGKTLNFKPASEFSLTV